MALSDISDTLKGILDNAYSVAGSLGLHPYEITVVKVFTTGSRPGVGTRNVVLEPLLLANGQNPMFKQVSGREVFLSNNQLTDKSYRIGPLVSSYTGSCGSAGGTDSSELNSDSTLSSTIKQQLYFRVVGAGMAPSGSFFRIKYRQEDSSLSYVIFVEDSGENVKLT